MSEPPTPDGDLFHEETDNPLLADRRNFFKVELWTRDGLRIERLLLAGKGARGVRRLHQERPRARLRSGNELGCCSSVPGACRFSRP